jgi:hypothetical protein
MDAEEFTKIFEAVQVLRLRPSDTLVFRSPLTMPYEMAERIKAHLQSIFGPKQRILVLGESCELQVVRPESEEPSRTL